MEEDSETVVSGNVTSPAPEHVDIVSLTLPIATDVNTDITDTPVAVSTPLSSTSETHDQQHS